METQVYRSQVVEEAWRVGQHTSKFIHQLFLVVVAKFFWVTNETIGDGMNVFGRDGYFAKEPFMDQSIV